MWILCNQALAKTACERQTPYLLQDCSYTTGRVKGRFLLKNINFLIGEPYFTCAACRRGFPVRPVSPSGRGASLRSRHAC